MPSAKNALPKLLWQGSINVSSISSSTLQVDDVQFWSCKSSSSSATRDHSAGRQQELQEPQQLIAVECVEVSDVALWMTSGIVMDVFTTNPETEAFLMLQFMKSSVIKSDMVSRGLILKSYPIKNSITGFLIFAHVVTGTTSSRVLIKAITLRTHDRNVHNILLQRASHHDLNRPTFLDLTVDDVNKLSSAQCRDEKLDKVINSKKTLLKQKVSSLRASHDDHEPSRSRNSTEALPPLRLLHAPTPKPEPVSRMLSTDTVITTAVLSDHEHSQQQVIVKVEDGVSNLQPGQDSAQETKNKTLIQRLALSALRLHGIDRENNEFKQLYHYTYRATVFAFRNKIQEISLPVHDIEKVVDKILSVFLFESTSSGTF
ncbi:hypothetical protein V1514DRAFT_365875 [Lipomyces japonicus]|uniref:uncharacterized protein n=1 Tax=Lipomyces japonicus TaxID=56871 RepID=UPI0034CD4B33